MGLTDVAGIFSRYFVIGFFLPAFFPLVLVSQIVDDSSTPVAFRDASGGTRLLVLGGVALLAALLLSSLHYHVVRLLEGYPIRRLEDLKATGRTQRLRRLLRGVPKRMSARWIRAFQKRTEQMEGPPSPARSRAARELNKYFPWRLQAVLPTRLGNAIRSSRPTPINAMAWMALRRGPGLKCCSKKGSGKSFPKRKPSSPSL
jgi:hypothetical protein